LHSQKDFVESTLKEIEITTESDYEEEGKRVLIMIHNERADYDKFFQESV